MRMNSSISKAQEIHCIWHKLISFMIYAFKADHLFPVKPKEKKPFNPQILQFNKGHEQMHVACKISFNTPKVM